jgi:hypothetical protein
VNQSRVTLGRVGPGLFQLSAEIPRNSTAIAAPLQQSSLSAETNLDDVIAQQMPPHDHSLKQ